MFKKGMTEKSVKSKMSKYSWYKLHDRLTFESGAFNLIYSTNANDIICFYFDENGKLDSYIY